MANRLVRQRGVLYSIAVIPLSLFLLFLDARLWGVALGVAVLVGTARHPRLHLLSLTLAALIAYAVGYRIEFITNPEGGFFYLTQWSWLITLSWIIAVSQGVAVVGQLDPSGKLLTKIIILSGGACALIALLQGQWLGVLFVIALFVILLGLRASALPPERWSRAVGYGLAIATIVGLVKTTASVALLAPLIAFGLPFTSTLSIAYRVSFSWLDELPFGRPRVLLFVYGLSAYASVLAFLATRNDREALAGAVGGGIAIGLLWWVLSRLPKTTAAGKRFVLLGTPIDYVTLDEAVQRIENFLEARMPAIVCTPDTTAIWRAQRDHKLREVYHEADLVTPDGTGVVWAGRLLGAPLRERVSGIDLLEKLFSRGRVSRIFLLGATPGVAEQAARKLTERYPSLQIVGTHHGYFSPHENEHIADLIEAAQPDMVLVGLGVPRQELWMRENRRKIRTAVLMGVGGCFDVWAGARRRAPRSWQRVGLEWLYRLLQEPRRLARVSAIPLFLGQIVLVKLAQLLSD
jgi:N-acetylglucosaminyldiphosphoundecaprenol N-acetyl-beta-D-mannosaminyltransferase